VNADGFVAVAHGQAGRAWVFDAIGDPVARVRTPGGSWTTPVAWHPDGARLAIVEAQTGSIYIADLGTVLAAAKEND
jgi:gluconolactonase